MSEYHSLMKNKTWSLVPLPQGRTPVGSRWVFKLKRKADGSIDKFKARLVAKGYSQEFGLDYGETFSPVVRYTSIRILIAIANLLDLDLHQMDVQTAFLNGKLNEEVYMVQPEGFIQPGQEGLVCKLHKSLYGLKQASRCWNMTMDDYLKKAGYRQGTADSCIYVKRVGDSFVIVALYVDDLLLAANNTDLLNAEKLALSNRFEMKDVGEAQYCLGLQIKRDRKNKRIWLSQERYLKDVLQKFGMSEFGMSE